MKKLLAMALALSMTVSLAACGKKEEGSTGSGSTPPVLSEGEFNWRACEGTKLNVLFSEHTYADAVKAKLDDFEKLTGIDVELTTMPESNYYEKLNVELASKSGSIDVFMTGAYQAWEYATAGYMEPLDDYIANPSVTNADYDYDDFIDGVINALKWDCVPGHPVGSGSQWALPMGWEINILTYNKNILAEHNVAVPETAEDLLAAATALNEFNGSGTYGLALRGTADWGTIHPAYMSLYTTWGAKDFEVEDGKLVAKVNSPEAIAMTEYWVDLVKKGSAPQWATYGWELAGADLGAGIAAMMWDADRGGYTQNVAGASAQAGNLAFGTVPYPVSAGKTADDMKSNLWVWSMGMNSASQNKEAAWYFLQYFSSKDFMQWSGTEGACTDTPRESVLKSDAYVKCLSDAEGYYEAFNTIKDTASIYFTAQPYFTETTTEWAKTLQELVTTDKYSSVEEAMNQLADTMNAIVADLEVS